ncbi:MAG: hypothetical protein KAT79_02610 [candidate division Zixibacteria bacterium]|nr:hypothetical protein [candidate division Zixibacteria bacterium]
MNYSYRKDYITTGLIALALICLALLPATTQSQEVVVVDFPIGVGSGVSQDFFRPHYPALQAIADTLYKYPLVRAIVTGGADGDRYRKNNDASNPSLALGRAHALRNVLLNEFKVDARQIIVQSQDSKAKGSQYRHATVRIATELSDFKTQLDGVADHLDGMETHLDGVAARLDTIAERPPVDQHITNITEVAEDIAEPMGLQLGVGLSSSPFGAIPVVTGAVTWERKVFVEAVVGHTLWNSSFAYSGQDLNTKRRMAGGLVFFYPVNDFPVGVIGGWIRTEEISTKYYDYVKMSEGPIFGLRYSPYKFLYITGAYNPARQRIVGKPIVESRHNEFMISVTGFILFGGEK